MSAEELLLKYIGKSIKLEKLKIENTIINYVKVGRGNPLLLLHGANIGWGQWYKNISYLSKYFTVYAIDLPGSGGSNKINYKKMNFYDDIIYPIIRFCQNQNLQKIHLVGHSIGSYVALKIVLSNSIDCRKLVVIEPLGLLEEMPTMYRPVAFYPIAYLLSRTLMSTSSNNVKSFLYSSVHNKMAIEEKFLNYCIESLNRDVSHPTILLMNRISGFIRINKEFVLLDQLDGIRIPTLVLVGRHDPMIPAKIITQNYKKIPNSTFGIYSNSAHLPFIEESQTFNKQISDFLRA